MMNESKYILPDMDTPPNKKGFFDQNMKPFLTKKTMLIGILLCVLLLGIGIYFLVKFLTKKPKKETKDQSDKPDSPVVPSPRSNKDHQKPATLPSAKNKHLGILHPVQHCNDCVTIPLCDNSMKIYKENSEHLLQRYIKQGYTIGDNIVMYGCKNVGKPNHSLVRDKTTEGVYLLEKFAS